MKKKQPFKKVTLKKGTMKRMFSYILKIHYKKVFFVVLLILVSSVVNVISSLFLQVLIDDYVTPLIGVPNPDFMPLIKLIFVMIGIYFVGIISTFLYNRVMIVV